jgi:hypothetical protein
MIYRTRYQRLAAACDLLLDLELRATHPTTKEICRLCYLLIAAPAEDRRRIESRVEQLLVKAHERQHRFHLKPTPFEQSPLTGSLPIEKPKRKQPVEPFQPEEFCLGYASASNAETGIKPVKVIEEGPRKGCSAVRSAVYRWSKKIRQSLDSSPQS